MTDQQLILNRYRPIAEAGAGGFATVQVAWDTRIQRKVAIKCLDLDEHDASAWGQGPSAIPGLEEARTAALLTDPNIVTVYDFEVQDGTAYLIMEYVEGVTLTKFLRNHRRSLSLDIVAMVFTSVAHALEVAHDNQVLHLDIKPDNVLINRQGQVKVTDFGLATLVDAGGFGTAVGGTIGYMPLEQMRQENLDTRCDEWALASLTYEMLAGENPFLASNLSRAEAAIEDAELVLPSLCWDGLDADADEILFLALDPDRDERFSTVAEFADELEPFLGDAKLGRKKLAVLVGEAPEENESELEPKPRIPFVNRVSDRVAAIVARVFAMMGTALISVVAAANLPLVTGWDSYLLWGLVALCVLGAVAKPHLGAFLSFVLWGVSMALSGALVAGILLVIVTVVWWWFAGRVGNAPACTALAQPLLGAVGFAGCAPILAGCFLSVGRAAATAAFSACTAILMSGLSIGNGLFSWTGGDTIAGWNVFAALPNQFWLSVFPGTDANGFVVALTQPSVWCTVISWVVAATAFSLFCLRGTKAFDLMGALSACVILVAGACAAAWLITNTAPWTPTSPSFSATLIAYLPNAVVPGIVGIVAAAIGITDRARWE